MRVRNARHASAISPPNTARCGYAPKVGGGNNAGRLVIVGVGVMLFLSKLNLMVSYHIFHKRYASPTIKLKKRTVFTTDSVRVIFLRPDDSIDLHSRRPWRIPSVIDIASK